MKKTVSILITAILILSFCLPVMADSSEELFYYDYTRPKILKSIELEKDFITKRHVEFLENVYLKDEEVDISKISYKPEKMFANRIWEPQNILDFMKAEDKAAYLETLETVSYSYPIFYDGVFTGQYVEVTYLKDEDCYMCDTSTDGSMYWHSVFIFDKDEIISILENKNITGYEILNSVFLGYNEYAIARKEGKCYLIKTIVFEGFKTPDNELFAAANENLLEKDILTLEEVETLVTSWNEIDAQIEASHDPSDICNENGGGVTLAKTKPTFPVLAVVIAIVAAAGAAVIIIIKKKKA